MSRSTHRATPRTSTRRPAPRRKVVALSLAVLGVAGLGLASAAQLGVGSSALGPGTSVVASFDADGVTVSFQNAYAATTKGYVVSSVVLSGVDANCVGQTVSLDLLASDPTSSAVSAASLGHVSAQVTAAGTVSIPVTGTAVTASQVNGIAVVIAS